VGANTDDLGDISRRLEIARDRRSRASRKLAAQAPRSVWDEYEAAANEVLRLERLQAVAKGEEYAEPIDFPVKWDTGAPMPHLFVTDNRALLAFLLSEPDPEWDGTNPRERSPAEKEPLPLALVEFEWCLSAKLGGPNDEVFSGHPLAGRGLAAYTAQRVVNSRWLEELDTINSVHPRYSQETWRDLQHYIFWFHDTTFECLAESFKVEVHRIRMSDLLHQMVERLIS
jgi:hypothetical protein